MNCANEICNKEFEPVITYNHPKKYCSEKCKNTAKCRRNRKNRSNKKIVVTEYKRCIDCGKVFPVKNKKSIACSVKCLGRFRQRKYKDYLAELRGAGCADCGVKNILYPEIFDFHHAFGKKKFELSKGASYFYSKPLEFDEEVKKCVVLCSNCHRIRHVKDRSNSRIGREVFT